MFCPKCGAANADNANFCTACGTALSVGETPGVTPPPPPPPDYTPVQPAYQGGYITPLTQPNYAGFWRRVAASLIDGLITGIAFAIIGFIFGLFFHPRTPGSQESLEEILQLVSTAGGWLYYALLESSASQATLGKQAMGIKVTDLNGNRISFARATGRYFAKILSALILCIGFIMVAFTAKKQGLHDLLAGTLVEKSSR